MQLDEAFYIRAKDRAEDALFRIPGVYGVALGPKIIAGTLTSKPAIQVFVTRKRPLQELSREERIPHEMYGVQTDVIEGPGQPQAANGTEQRCNTGKITAATVAPNKGIRVTRSYQFTRWIDGSSHLWIGRRKGVGSGEGSSGLRFDSLEP